VPKITQEEKWMLQGQLSSRTSVL